MRNLSVRNKVKLLIEFCEEHERLPRYAGKGMMESKLYYFSLQYRNNKTVYKLRRKYRSNRSFEENLVDLISFCELNKALPNRSDNGLERRLKSFLSKHRHDPLVKPIIEKYRRKEHSIKTKEQWIAELTQFCETHGRLPGRSIPSSYESRLANFRARNLNNEEVKLITEKYRRRSEFKRYDVSIDELKSFVTEHKRLPSIHNVGQERRLSAFIVRARDKRDEVKDIVMTYRKYKPFKENLDDLVNWVIEHDRLPKYDSKNKEQFRLRTFMARHKDNKRVMELIKKYGGI